MTINSKFLLHEVIKHISLYVKWRYKQEEMG